MLKFWCCCQKLRHLIVKNHSISVNLFQKKIFVNQNVKNVSSPFLVTKINFLYFISSSHLKLIAKLINFTLYFINSNLVLTDPLIINPFQLIPILFIPKPYKSVKIDLQKLFGLLKNRKHNQILQIWSDLKAIDELLDENPRSLQALLITLIKWITGDNGLILVEILVDLQLHFLFLPSLINLVFANQNPENWHHNRHILLDLVVDEVGVEAVRFAQVSWKQFDWIVVAERERWQMELVDQLFYSRDGLNAREQKRLDLAEFDLTLD